MDKMYVAKEILNQLGGNQFRMMVGAHNLVGSDNSLALRFKGSRKWNALRVELTPMDVYKVTFLKVGPKTFKESIHEDVYNEDLIPLFERETGLYCKLFG